MLKRNERKHLKKLKKQKLYDDIYKEFGRKYFLRKTPFIYKFKDYKRLMNEKRFFELYEKYGNLRYKIHLKKMLKQDVKNELGTYPIFNKYLFLEKCKKKLKFGKRLAMFLTASFIAIDIFLIELFSYAVSAYEIKDENKLNRLIEEYNEDINDYAAYINELELSDLEVIIKEIDDMWSTIYGYNSDVYEYRDILTDFRLTLHTNGSGVCRHMADDFTARMNAINPEYEAYNLYVYITGADVNNIERYVFKNDRGTIVENDNIIEQIFNQLVARYLGNHIVTCLTIPDEDLTLVVDATNPSIGILKNGQIYMLTENEELRQTIDISRFNIAIKKENKEEIGRFFWDIIKSYFEDISIYEAIEKYGIDAQNEVLEDLKSKYDSSQYKLNIETVSGPLKDSNYRIGVIDETCEITKYYSGESTLPVVYTGYRQINQCLNNHTITRLEIECCNNDIDFSQIDFSNLDVYINFLEYNDKNVDLTLKENINSLELIFPNSSDINEVNIVAPGFIIDENNFVITGIDVNTVITLNGNIINDNTIKSEEDVLVKTLSK